MRRSAVVVVGDPVRESAAEALARAERDHDTDSQVPPNQTGHPWDYITPSYRAAYLADARRRLDALTAAGYRLAGPGEVVVPLPEPVDVVPVCICDTSTDGVPGTGCGAECTAPGLAWFEGGVSLDLRHGAIYDGTGRTFEADAAELQAARLLSAAALYRATSPAGPTTCACGIDLPGATPEHMPDCALMASPAEPTEVDRG